MTKREFIETAMKFEGATEEFKAKGEEMLKGLDKRNTKPTKAQIANEGIKGEIAEVLAGKELTAKEIADAVGQTTNKVAALLRQMPVEKVAGEKAKDAPKYRIAEQSKCCSPYPMGQGVDKGQQLNGKSFDDNNKGFVTRL